MFRDMVDNTNPVLAALQDSEEVIMAGLYVHPTQGYFNMKQHLHWINNYNPAVSECLSEKQEFDKLEYDNEFDKLSQFSDE